MVCITLVISISSVYCWFIARGSLGAAEKLCERSCGAMRGVYIEETCYCENEGLSLVPIELIILDTGAK